MHGMRWVLRARRPASRLMVAMALALAWARASATALGASPAPTSGTGGDPRSSGQGPGLVGDPVLAIAIVVAIAALTLVATLAYVRATAGRDDRSSHR